MNKKEVAKEKLNGNRNSEDLELIRRIRQENDQRAWESLYEAYMSDIKQQVKLRLETVFDPQQRKNMYDDLCQEGWKAFVQAVKNFNPEKSGGATFRTYAGSYIRYAVKNAFAGQLNSLGLTHRPNYNQHIQSVLINTAMEENPNFDIPDYRCENEENGYEKYIEELIQAGEISDKGNYDETRRAIQILETLRLMTDEKHTMTKADLAKCLCKYRMLVHHNCVKPEAENTLKASIDKLLLELDPEEYSPEIDDKYVIKYDGYKENRLAENMRIKEQKKSEQGKGEKGKNRKGEKVGDFAKDITNFYYQHPFSYDDLDKMIAIIAFTDLISEEEKLDICNKLMRTASTYYENAYVGRERLRFNPNAVSGRYTHGMSKGGNTRSNLAENLHILEQAMQQMVQVRFVFNRYDETGELVSVSNQKHILSPYRLVVYQDEYYCIGLKMDGKKIWHYRVDLMSDIEFIKDEEGSPVPVELLRGSVPSAISAVKWDPQKYMAEHLYMGYDEPRSIRIKIKNTDYNILQHWFGENYKKIKSKSEGDYDVVEVRTSPALLVPWALQYGERVEILDPDIRKKIRKQLKDLKEKYKDE